MAPSSTPAPNGHPSYPTITPHLYSHVEIRSTEDAGRGVFASKDLPAGFVVEISPVLLFPSDEYEEHGKHTQLDSYTFIWDQGGKVARPSQMALALGIGSLFNHDPRSPSVNYTLDRPTQTIRFSLVRSVKAGEELCISYGAGRMWWEEEKADAADSDPDDEAAMMRMALSDDDGGGDDTGCPPPPTSSIVPAPDVEEVHADDKILRITTAVDPQTCPLELMDVYVIDLEPRNSGLFLRFLRDFAEELTERCEDQGEGMRHLRTFKRTEGAADEGRREELQGVICRVSDAESDEAMHELLRRGGAEAFALGGRAPELKRVAVPATPPPSRGRVDDWNSRWPVALRVGSYKSTAIGPDRANLWGASVPHFIDRSADRRLWAEERNAKWLRDNFRRCIDMAAEARGKGELPIGVHVTMPFVIDDEGVRSSRDAAVLASHAAFVGPPLPNGSASLERMIGNHGWIEAGAWDTRVGERNPMKHGVTNAIRLVASIRADRDRERREAAGLPSGPLSSDAADENGRFRTPSPTVRGGNSPAPDVRPSRPAPARRLPSDPARSASSSGDEQQQQQRPKSSQSNGQDYLLNSLALFTTHEPCVSCCMALVHSRVRAVFFLLPAPGTGGLCGASHGRGVKGDGRRGCLGGEDGGPYAVHEQSGLNHRFEVWRWIGDLEELAPGLARAKGARSIKDLLDVKGASA